MANGYIGKISAVVTANTSDLSRKLAGSVKDVDQFANRLAASVERSSQQAQNSLNNIFTPLQRLERSLRAGVQNNVFKRDNVDQYVRSVRQAVSISEQINKPLAGGASAFQKLSLEVQAAFLPALNRAQGAVVNLSTTLQQQGSVSERTFGQVEQVVNRTTAAIQRLAQAQQIVASGPSSSSLAFAAPRVSQSLQASAAVRQQASQLPASQLSAGGVTRQVANLEAVERRIVQTQARLESVQARPRVDSTELAAAQKELDRLLAGAERIRASIQVRFDAKSAIADAKALIASFKEIRSQQEFRSTGRFQNIEQAKESLQQAIALQEKLTSGQRAAIQPSVATAIDAVESASASGDPGDLAAAQAAIDKVTASAQSGIKLNLQSEEAQKAANDLDAKISQIKENAAFVVTGTPQNFDQVQSELNRVLETLERLSPAERGGLGSQIDAVINLVGKQDLDGAVKALDTLRLKAGDTIDIKVEADAATSRIDSLSNTWQRALSGIPASAKEIDSEFQSLANRISRLDIGGRVQLDNLVQDFQASVKAGDPLIKQYQKLLALASAVDKVDGRGLRATGDVTRGAFGNASLAIQQATFAVDDFFSVTGGLDQRIRAAGNNISENSRWQESGQKPFFLRESD